MANTDPIYAFDGRYRFLSNFWDVNVRFESETYPSSEHAFQAAKTLDRAWRNRIRNCETAGKAKRMGRKCPLRPNWDNIRLDVMRIILREKFSHPILEAQLLMTGDRELIEGNSWGDTFWGVCKGVGENWLGKLLMELRAEIREARE